jgi:hypothetical protein
MTFELVELYGKKGSRKKTTSRIKNIATFLVVWDSLDTSIAGCCVA